MRATRDANTLLYIGFPVLAYPLTIWAMLQGFTYIQGANDRLVSRVVLSDVADDELLTGEKFMVLRGTLEDLDAGRLDALVERDGRKVTLHHRAGSAQSRNAVDQIEKVLREEQKIRRETLATELDVPLYKTKAKAVGDPADIFAWFLGMFAAILAPATLVISITYPTMELFVIEREKATLETLLTSAVGRWEIVGARLVVAAGLATFAALANVMALGLVVVHGAVLLLDDLTNLSMRPSVDWLAIPVLLASGGLVITTIVAMVYAFARTFREAQTLFSFCAMLLLAPSIVASFACMNHWSGSLVAAPLFHTSTLSFDAIRDQLTMVELLIGVSTDLLFVGALLVIWDRIFGIETLLTGVARPAWFERLTGGSQ